MSVQVKTPTRTLESANTGPVEAATCSGQPVPVGLCNVSGQQGMQKKRRHSHIAESALDSSIHGAKKRRHGSYRGAAEKTKLPSKFYLGGNISDPLNLAHSDNEVEEEPTPVKSLVDSNRPSCLPPPRPVNVTDPLNLSVDIDSAEEPALLSPTGTRRKRKKLSKKQLEKLEISFDQDDVEAGENQSGNQQGEIATCESASANTGDTKSNLITSPVIGQNKQVPSTSTLVKKSPVTPLRQESIVKRRDSTGNERRKRPRRDSERSGGAVAEAKKQVPKLTEIQTLQTKQKKPFKFIHGNYNRYYGYRNMEELEADTRLCAFKPSWFKDKDVLDIGCNIGHVTLSVARDFRPKRIVGMDIDGNLIRIARKNIRHYEERTTPDGGKFPCCMPALYGPLKPGPRSDQAANRDFPQNVSFMQGNHVLENDDLLEMVQPEFDVIMALSVTKWIHLNNGDDGLKRSFKRMFRQLRPGGRLILEPQQWPSYKRRKNLTENIKRTFKTITLKPDQFNEYLLSEVGFTRCEKINMPDHKAKGFRRPVFVFLKADERVKTTSQT